MGAIAWTGFAGPNSGVLAEVQFAPPKFAVAKICLPAPAVVVPMRPHGFYQTTNEMIMKTSIPSFTIAALAAALVIGAAVYAPAQSTNANATTNKPAKKETSAKKEAPAKGDAAKSKDARIPFKGSVGAVDRITMTIKVGERTFQVTSATRIIKAGKPATFSDATVGEECAGSYKKTADDKLELLSLRLGPKADGAAAPATPAEPKQKPAQQ